VNTAEIQRALKVQGWPIADDGAMGAITRQAVHDFQGAWVPSPGRSPLSLDGQPGPDTQWALQWVLDHDLKVAGHFRAREFASKGNGWIKVSRDLLWHLDRYRERYGPVRIISGYRDPAHNRRVGGATRSRHLFADAADIEPRITVAQAREIGFKGIGYNASSGRVSHVDMRPGGVVVWRYGR
jgi:hypothetical protein